MGFFNRLKDFGDREQVRTYAYRISVGIEQIECSKDLSEIKGLSIAVRKDVQMMMMFASKLTRESLNCLDVNANGCKMLFANFMNELVYKSNKVVAKGGFSLIE